MTLQASAQELNDLTSQNVKDAENFQERRWLPLLQITTDILVLEASIFVAALIRILLAPLVPIDLAPAAFIGITIAVLFIPAIYLVVGLYPGYGLNPVERFRKRIEIMVSVFLVLVTWDYMFQDGQWSRGLMIVTFLIVIVISPAIDSLLVSFLVRLGWWGNPVIVVGTQYNADTILNALRLESRLGLVPIAYFDDDDEHWGKTWHGVNVIGPVSEAKTWNDKASTVIVCLQEESSTVLSSIQDELPFHKVNIVPDLGSLQSLWVTARDLGGIVGLEVKNNLLVRRNRAIKRVIDLVIGFIAVLPALPVILLFAGLVKVFSPGPAFYFQKREGYGGEPIKVWKLRTMYVDAEQRLEAHLASDPEAKAEWEKYVKLRNDPRIIGALGRFMRRWSIDELPQLIAVLSGQLSLVGPRPFPDYHLEKFDTVFRTLRTQARPGLTGLWQISARSEGDLQTQEQLDSYYIQNWSLWLDFYILYRTLAAVVAAEGAR